jgi:hypothetical protein
MPATFRVQICYPVDLVINNSTHKAIAEGDPSVALDVLQVLLEFHGRTNHALSLKAATDTIRAQLLEGPQKMVFQSTSSKALLRG